MIFRDRALLFLLIATAGMWGCAKVSPSAARDADKIKSLEARIVKLEDDFRTAAMTRDQLRQKLAAVEKEKAMLEKQMPMLTQERDELRQQLSSRTTERDTLQAQYDGFRKEIRTLLGQADASAAGTSSQPVTAAPILSIPGKS